MRFFAPMTRWRFLLSALMFLCCTACGSSTSLTVAATAVESGNVDNLQVPSGFHVSLFAHNLTAPRFIAFSPDGTLFAAERGTGRILAFLDAKHTGQPSATVVVADGLNDPTSVFFASGSLYVGVADGVIKMTVGPDLHSTSTQQIISGLPVGGNHSTRTVLVGTDGRIYVSIGSTCNDCIETDALRATVMVFAADGSNGRIFASGIRNAVGMAINPWTGATWVTDNGRDNLGDNLPPDTIYQLQDGGNYGWPRCHAGTIIDPDLGHPGDCTGIIAPLVNLQAHSAPLGLAFYHQNKIQNQFPSSYQGMYVAFHGSWNRTVPTGYKVVFIPMDASGKVSGSPQDFLTGTAAVQGQVTGRPVGVVAGPDGALYVSTDQGGSIYRITYGK